MQGGIYMKKITKAEREYLENQIKYGQKWFDKFSTWTIYAFVLSFLIEEVIIVAVGLIAGAFFIGREIEKINFFLYGFKNRRGIFK